MEGALLWNKVSAGFLQSYPGTHSCHLPHHIGWVPRDQDGARLLPDIVINTISPWLSEKQKKTRKISKSRGQNVSQSQGIPLYNPDCVGQSQSYPTCSTRPLL